MRCHHRPKGPKSSCCAAASCPDYAVKATPVRGAEAAAPSPERLPTRCSAPQSAWPAHTCSDASERLPHFSVDTPCSTTLCLECVHLQRARFSTQTFEFGVTDPNDVRRDVSRGLLSGRFEEAAAAARHVSPTISSTPITQNTAHFLNRNPP